MWTPGETLLIDWGVEGGLHVFCAVLGWSRFRFIRLIDTRTLAPKDTTAVGILSASPGLDDTIAAYASGAVNPRPLIAATVGLDQVSAVLTGQRPPGAGPGPKIHIDPRLS